MKVSMGVDKPNPCAYCATFLRHEYIALQPWDTIIERRRNFAIVPSKGALIPGWLLVVSEQHHIASAALDKNERIDLEEGIESARLMVESVFGAATIFENGPSAKATALGCGIDHVHIHVVPLGFSLSEATRRRHPSIEWLPCESLAQLSTVHSQGKAYFYVREPNRSPVFAIPKIRQSQLLRRVIAAEVGKEQLWDYTSHFGLDNISRTLESLSLRH
jgi:ATP adenylyltransferase